MTEKFEPTFVSVIIATRNRHEEIYRALSGLIKGSRQPEQIVICDQSTNTLTKDQVSRFQRDFEVDFIDYYSSTKRGISANRNDALAAAKGDFIVSIDDDIEVDTHWLRNMLCEWTEKWNRGPVLITGPILPAPEFEPGALITAVRTFEERIVFEGKPKYSDVLIGAQFGAPAILFEKFDPAFDERLGAGCRYPGADDEEFAYRVQKLGVPVVYEPSIRVTHYTERVSDWRSVNFKYGAGNGAAMAKHICRGDYRVALELLKAIGVNAVKGILHALRLREPEASGRLVAAFGLISGCSRWMFAVVLRNNGTARVYGDSVNSGQSA